MCQFHLRLKLREGGGGLSENVIFEFLLQQANIFKWLRVIWRLCGAEAKIATFGLSPLVTTGLVSYRVHKCEMKACVGKGRRLSAGSMQRMVEINCVVLQV